MSLGKTEKMQHCKRATYLLEKRQFTSLSLIDLFWLKIHLLSCDLCALYSRQTLVINALIRDLIDEKETMESPLDAETKQRIHSLINNHLN